MKSTESPGAFDFELLLIPSMPVNFHKQPKDMSHKVSMCSYEQEKYNLALFGIQFDVNF